MDLTEITGFLGRPLEYPLAFSPIIFIFGALIGSLLNVCIYRMPLEKSLWWPGSRCSNCYQPVRKLDNLPILSYWILGGRCRTCGVKFSSRYFLIELFTASMFAGLFYYYLAMLPNAPESLYRGVSKFALLGMWAYHITFLCFLLVAVFTDFDHREIPLRLTIPGTVIGIIFGTFGGWPWPVPIDRIGPNFEGGMQFWPFWAPLADATVPFLGALQPGSWQVGFLTAFFGALAGTAIIRILRLLFSWAYEREAMGLGDADLLMLIGAFLGWQALILVMGYAIVLGLVLVLLTFLFKGSGELPFGPPLAGGAVLVLFDNLFAQLHNLTRPFFFNSLYVAAAVFFFLFLCFNACLILRFVRVAFRPVKAM
jgi:leader peptidase (prepilin peptidase)/N-methyltransferase